MHAACLPGSGECAAAPGADRLPPAPPARRASPWLQGQEKMSKSDPNSAIFMEDTEQEVGAGHAGCWARWARWVLGALRAGLQFAGGG